MTYVPLTVGRGRTPFTVARGASTVFTVTGHPGGTGIDRALLTEDGSPLLLESGGYLLFA